MYSLQLMSPEECREAGLTPHVRGDQSYGPRRLIKDAKARPAGVQVCGMHHEIMSSPLHGDGSAAERGGVVDECRGRKEVVHALAVVACSSVRRASSEAVDRLQAESIGSG